MDTIQIRRLVAEHEAILLGTGNTKWTFSDVVDVIEKAVTVEAQKASEALKDAHEFIDSCDTDEPERQRVLSQIDEALLGLKSTE